MITTTYYTTLEKDVVSTEGKSVNGKTVTQTVASGKVVAPQPQTVAALPKQSAAASTAAQVTTQNSPNASGKSGIQASVEGPVKAATTSVVPNTGSDSKQGKVNIYFQTTDVSGLSGSPLIDDVLPRVF